MLDAKNITVTLPDKKGQKTLLNDVSVQVKAGEVLALLGPNGAGKSTLFSVLTGARKPQKGSVMLEGVPLSEIPVKALAKRRAVLSQALPIAFPFTVMEIVLMGRSPHVKTSESAEDYHIVESALAQVDALHLKDRIFPTLSGGEQQRVQLARVLAQIWQQKEGAQRYLFLDEPTSALDLKHQFAVLELAKDLAAQGVAVCIILHDLNLAKHFADQVLFLKNGVQIASGTVKKTITQAMIQQVYDVPTAHMKLLA